MGFFIIKYKTYFHRALGDWMFGRAGIRATLYHLGYIINKAFNVAFSRRNIINGFQTNGIVALNEDTFCDEELLLRRSSFFLSTKLLFNSMSGILSLEHCAFLQQKLMTTSSSYQRRGRKGVRKKENRHTHSINDNRQHSN